jgi:hypothetical protein
VNLLIEGLIWVFSFALLSTVISAGFKRLVRRFSGAATPVWITEFADRINQR